MKKNDIEKEFLATEVIEKTNPQKKKKINSKQKGSNAEREASKIFTSRFPDHPFSRTFFSGAYTGGSNFGRADNMTDEQKLMVCGDIHSDLSFKFSIEHKFYAEASFWDLFNDSSDLHSWMEQAQHDADFIGKSPMLVVKYNNKKRIVYIHEKPSEPIFSHNGWNCYWLEDLFKQPDSFFF